MRTNSSLTATTCLKALTVSGLLGGSALAQHVHGVVDIGIVVEGQELAVSLDAPLSDVVGFEHAPETEAQEEQLRTIASMLWDAEAMFGTPEAAGCTARDATVEAPDYVIALRENGSAEAHTDDADHGPHDDHAEASHDGHSDHDDRAHGDHEGHGDHAEISAQYVWVCSNPQALDGLTADFARKFTSLETVNVQIVSAAGARVLETDGQVDTISLTTP